MKKEKLDKNEEIQKLSEQEENKAQGKKVKKAWKDGRTFIKGKKALRLRRTKNFGFWLSGVFSSFIIFLAGILVAVAVLPVSVYFGGKENSNQYVSDGVSSKSILSNVQNAQNITLNDVPVLKNLISTLADTVNGAIEGGSDLIVIDQEKLESLSGTPLFGGETPAISSLMGCVKVVANIDSFGIDLGAIGTLDIMQDFEEVDGDESLDAYLEEGTSVENPKLYYYDQNSLITNGGGDTFADGDPAPVTPNYVRAFDDNGELCADLRNLSNDQLKQVKFYYPALRKVPVTDLLSVFDVRFKALTVRSILESFGDGIDEESPIIKIVGDESIASLGTLSQDEIKLVDFLDPPSDDPTSPDYDTNRQIYDILLSASGKTAYEELSMGDLSNLNMDNVKLVDVIDEPTEENEYKNQKIYDVLLEATNKSSYSEITILDMNNFEINDVKLSTVIEAPSSTNGYKNKKMFDIFLDVTEKTSYDEITVLDLNGFRFDKVKLITILDAPTSDDPADGTAYSNNRKLFDILMDATGTTNTGYASYSQLIVKDLDSFDMDNVKFSTIMESSTNKIIQGLLNSDDPNNPNDDVTVGNMDAKINALDVETVYDKHCFTDDVNKAASNATPYYLTIQKIDGVDTKVYSKTGTGTKYYIAKDSGIWLFLEFRAENVDYSTTDYVGTGSAERYIDKHLTIGQMDSNIGNISAEIIHSSIHQLYECGMLEEEYENIRGMKVLGVIDKLNEIDTNL